MRLRRPWALAMLLLLLAGCNDGGDDPGVGDDDAGPGAGPTDSEDAGEIPDAADGFAVLVATGRLEGEGPPPGAIIACSIAPPDGHLDAGAKEAWAKPGQHSFKANRTWLVVVDEVEIDDPRASSCGIRTATPFTATGNWQPQLGDGAFSLDVSPDGDRLLVSRNGIAPGESFETYVEFEDGEYTFSGTLTFTHAGWWEQSAFEEREEDVPAGDEAAIWWD